MNKSLALFSLVLSATSIQAVAAQEEARVISSRPVIQQFQVPQQVCTSTSAAVADSDGVIRGTSSCSTQVVTQEVTVYDVEYEYAGRRYRVQMPQAPGATLTVGVSPVAVAAPAIQEAQVLQAPVTTITYTSQPVVVAPQVVTRPVYVTPYAYAYPYPFYPSYYGSPYAYFPPISIRLGYTYIRSHHR